MVGLIWCAHYDRWTAEAWQVPTEYTGDASEVLTSMKAASEGAMWPLRPKVVDRLGAPFGAHWNAYPIPDKPVMLVLGAFVKRLGVFVAANLGMLFATVSAALAFYFVGRWLRMRWEWAAAGALLYAFTYQTFHRGLGHFSLTLSWTIPLGLLAVWLVARSRRLEWRTGGAIICLAAAVALGFGNPYYLMFWLQLMGWAVIAQWLDRRRRANLSIGLAAIGIAAAVFFASHLEVWVFIQEPEASPLLARNYGGTELYALKPVEMLIPPPVHRWDALAFFGHRYVRWTLFRGEGFLPYLGLVGIAGLLWLGVVTIRRLLTRRPVPGQALTIGWLVAYAAMGGVTNVLALILGFQVFRATNRAAVFISALVLFFLFVRLSRVTARWPSWGRRGLALAVVSLGLLDQVPKSGNREDRAGLVAQLESDRKLGVDLEAALPDGAMIFQLPVVGFPEERPPHQLGDYELFRPYLMTETLRFSYGAVKYRARSRWQQEVEAAPAETMVRRLESYGFSALYLNRRGFADQAEGLLGELRELGYDRQIVSALGQQVVVLLQPAARPTKPLSEGLSFGRTWYPRTPDGIRWAFDDGVVSYFNPYPVPLTADLLIKLVAPSEREVTLRAGSRALRTVRVEGSEPVELRLPNIEFQPGVNVLTLQSSEPPRRLGSGRYQLRTFGVQEARVRLVSN